MTPTGSSRHEDDLNEQDLLLQRFLDNELAPVERLALLQRLDADPALRRQLLAMERLTLETAALPKPTLPSDFKAQLMSRLDGPKIGWWGRVKKTMLMPHVLHWNPAMALTAACAVLALVWMVQSPDRAVSPPSMVAQTTAQEEEVLVRLVLVEPRAKSVAVAGDFNSWVPEKTPLRQSKEGVWTTTLRVKPGRYHYMFVVDGQQWVADPLAPEYSLDGFGSKNAVLDVDLAM